MARTVDDIFAKAMSLTDNLDDEGNWDTSDNEEYKHRTLHLLNSFIGELYIYSNTYEIATEAGKRSIIAKVDTWEDGMPLDDYLCDDLCPYKLAALLMADENTALAQTMENIYLSRLAVVQAGKNKSVIIPSASGQNSAGASIRAIVNGDYGLNGRTHGFTRWNR